MYWNPHPQQFRIMYLLGVWRVDGWRRKFLGRTLINILYSFSRPSVLAQICKLDQTEGNFWKREISIWTAFINTPLAPGWCACCWRVLASTGAVWREACWCEGRACPESHWVGEEGTNFLASYQILQQGNDQFGWVRKTGEGTMLQR